MNWSKLERRVGCCMLPALLTTASLAQESGGSEVEKLTKKVGDLESQVADLREQQAQGQDETGVSLDEIDEQLTDMSKNMSTLRPGKRSFLLTGYAYAGFNNSEGSDSTFGAGFVPIFLWKIDDDLFVEGEAEFELEDSETHVALEYLQASYVLNDSMILGFGKFLSPSNPFADRLHPAWINKLPDAPLGLGPQRIMPFTQLGVQLHGGVPVGSQKVNYALYVSNGPSLEEDAGTYGSLGDENLSDLNNNKAIGGRIGYFPLPELEFGYSLEFSQVTASGSDVSDADATIQSFDVNYTASIPKGTLDLRGQWAFSDLSDVVYDPNATDFGPATLDNSRNGGYLQAAYRPSEVKSSMLSRCEGVVRYDQIDLPDGAPESTDQSRWTFGLNYWTGASSVFKLAYRMDDRDAPGTSVDAVMFQWAVGL